MISYWNKTKVIEPYRMRCLPYAYFVGVAKSGTSDFFAKFVKHPSVTKPSMKEPEYFNWNRLHSKYGHLTPCIETILYQMEETLN